MLLRRRLFFSPSLQYVSSGRRRLKFQTFAIKNASASSGRSGRARKVYTESQSEAAPSTSFPVKEIASSVLPVGSFIVVTFVMWKLVEKLMMPKKSKAPVQEKKPTEGVKWSFAAGTNLLPNFGAKIERESKLRLNDFSKELRSFSIVDMSGRNFGDEGLFFLAESLAYNQVAEEVNFAANGITAEGIKAFDGILQSNISLKVLNLSGNSIGDEGAKVLCDILVDNSGIQKLQLNSTNIGSKGHC